MNEWFKNLANNLKASAPATVIIVWLVCFTSLAIFGEGTAASSALGALAGAGVLIILAMGHKV